MPCQRYPFSLDLSINNHYQFTAHSCLLVLFDKLEYNRRMVSSWLLRRMALVRTDVSEEPGASFIRVTKIGELGTTQAATSNRPTLA
jgi:hypothetical protein